jgi:hypothetical protein
MLALFCLAVTGCGGGGGSSPATGNSGAVSFKISGTVTVNGTGVGGATVTLSGTGAAVAFTNTTGNYTFSGLKNGSYTVTITKKNYSCQPRIESVTVSGANVSGANFSARVASPEFYVIDNANQLAVVNIDTRTVNVIGNTQVFLNDLAFDSSGTLFGVSGDNLYRIDTGTAAATLVGPLGTNDTTSLEFGPSGKLYTANTSLYTVNTSTGAASVVGNGGDFPYRSSGDLVFVGTNLYLTSTYSPTSNALVRLDPATGVGTLVGPIDFPSIFGLSSNDNVTLYGFAGTKVLVIDPSTGVGTLLWDIGSSQLSSINGAAAP